MTTLTFILILLLHFEGFSGEELHLYHRVGEDVVLPCNSPSSSFSCDIVTWIYSRGSNLQIEVWGGKVSQESVRAARMRLDSRCSLIINNITAEDYGRYTCRPGEGVSLDGSVYLDTLSISSSDPGPTKDGPVSLKCSLLRQSSFTCPEKIILWVDETGAELLHEDDEDDGSRLEGGSNCVSSVKVKRQRGRNRTLTCQVFVKNQMKIDVHYTVVLTADPIQSNNKQVMIIVGSVAGAVLLVAAAAAAAAVLIKRRRRTRITEDQKTTDVQEPNPHSDEPESSVTIDQSSVTIGQSSVTYATIDHFNQDAPHNTKVEEDVVTYSAVRTKMKSEVDIDPSTLYSCVSKPK